MWLDIYDANNNKLGAGPIRNIEYFEATANMSAAGTYRFGGIVTDLRTQELLLDESGQRYAIGWEMINGAHTYVGGGPIHQRVMTGEPGAWKLEISGPDMLAELTYDVIGSLSLSGDGNTSKSTLLSYLLALPIPWSVTSSDCPDFVAKFSNETILNAIIAVVNKVGAYFFHSPSGTDYRRFTWRDFYPDSGIVASSNVDALAVERNPNLCLITNIKESYDSWDIINTVVVFGAGVGETRFTMASATVWPDGSLLAGTYTQDGQTYVFDRVANTITNITSVSAYGTRKMQLPFKDVRALSNGDIDVLAAANFLVLAAVNWLDKHSKVEKFYELGITGLRQWIVPGNTLRVQARKWEDGRKPVDIDTNLIVVSTSRRWDNTGHYTTGLQVATVARFPASSDDAAIQSMSQSIVMEAHPQTGPAIDTITYREHLDDEANAHLYFFLGNEVLTVNQVIVRMRADPLRSTVKSIAGGSTTTPSGGGGTTPSGGGNTSDISYNAGVTNHAHNVVVQRDTATHGSPLYWDSGVGLNYNGGSIGLEIGQGTDFTDLTDHHHIVFDHIHTTPDHQHTFTPVVDMAYGIFDDLSGNTYLATDLDYRVNGSTWTRIDVSNAISGATGWYLLDITSLVASSIAGRPVATVFDVEFKVHTIGAGKRAQITAQIERRMSIQGIAVY